MIFDYYSCVFEAIINIGNLCPRDTLDYGIETIGRLVRELIWVENMPLPLI